MFLNCGLDKYPHPWGVHDNIIPHDGAGVLSVALKVSTPCLAGSIASPKQASPHATDIFRTHMAGHDIAFKTPFFPFTFIIRAETNIGVTYF